MAAAGTAARLEIGSLRIAFGKLVAVQDVSLAVREGETVAIFGPNGAGKTTFLKGGAGLIPVQGGTVGYRGEELSRLPAPERAARGIRYVSDRSRVAVRMTVRENLDAGAWLLPAGRRKAARERVLSLFPSSGRRRGEPAGVLSGGERQMLILARALIGEPSLLLLDEPFLGLAREIRDRFVSVIETTLKGRVTILMAEHDAETGFRVMDRLAIFRNGALVHERARADVRDAGALLALLHKHFRPEKERRNG
jgi:branched-chain amino acid transport system ATP-binding protein